MPNQLVTYADVDDLLMQETTAESPQRKQLEILCTRAEAEIRANVPGVDQRLALQPDTPAALSADLVKGVGVDMVIAALENLELGFRATREAHPEIETSQVALASSVLMEITDAQIRKLSPRLPQQGAYVVSLGG